MFPDVGEFNLVVAGLATFAATVGYACTRRLSTSTASTRPELRLIQRIPNQTDSNMQVDINNDVKPADDAQESMAMEHDGILPAPSPLVSPLSVIPIPVPAPMSHLSATTPPAPTRRESLKRKAPEDGFDEPNVEDRGYPYNLANIYPNKRSRTPSSDSIASTPSTSSQNTRPPSPVLESTIDTTFDAVIVSHMTVSPASTLAFTSEPSSIIDPAPTPTTEPPTSPSPVPSYSDAPVENQEVEELTPARARSPTPVSTATPSPTLPFTPLAPAPSALMLGEDTEKEKTKFEKSLLPPALSPIPVFAAAHDSMARQSTPKPFTSASFATFANQDAFGASRPTTPKSTFTSASSGFAAFAGSASPFAAAAALNKPPAASSLFGSTSTSFFRLKPITNTINTGTLVLPNANVFGAGTPGSASNIFGTSAAAGSIFGTGCQEDKSTELLAADKFLDNVLGPKGAVALDTEATSEEAAKEENNPENSKKDINRDADEAREKEEREQREMEEREKETARRAARAKEEEEVRLQEAREKQVRKEAKLRERQTGHAIVEAKVATHPTEKFTPLTGEEDENVELEQKSVKLYVKRGDRPFSEGIPGLIKVLANRTTAEERILFRRDPLLKVSMNVRVQPTVRVTFVPEESVLRCILKETVSDAEDGVARQEVAIYVIKPGRYCSKQDFKAFAEGLMQRSQLKEGAEKLKARSA